MPECGEKYLYLVRAGDYTPTNRCLGPTVGDQEVAATEFCYSKWFDAALAMQTNHVMPRYLKLARDAFRKGKKDDPGKRQADADVGEFQRRVRDLPKPFGCYPWDYIAGEPHCHLLPINPWSRVTMAVDTMMYGACAMERMDATAEELGIQLDPAPEEPAETPGDPDAGMDLYDVVLTLGIAGIVGAVGYGLATKYMEKKIR